MISLPNIKQLEKVVIDNSPVILTVVGVVGTIGTAVLTHRAATRAQLLIMEDESVGGTAADPKQRLKDRTKLVWKEYIPPVVVGTLTIGAVVGANHVGSKRAAAIAAAYTILDKTSTEYREKVIEKLGEAKETKVRDEIAQDRVKRNPPTEGNIVIVGNGETLCQDAFSGRYFRSSMEDLKKAQNDTNYEILHNSYASVSDFYDRIGLSHTTVSDEMGWNQDNLLELHFSAVITESGEPCITYDFHSKPIRGYHRLHP